MNRVVQLHPDRTDKSKTKMLEKDFFVELIAMLNQRQQPSTAIVSNKLKELLERPVPTEQLFCNPGNWDQHRATLANIAKIELPDDPATTYGQDVWDLITAAYNQYEPWDRRALPMVSYGCCSAVAQLCAIKSMRAWFDHHSSCFKPMSLPFPVYPSVQYSEWENWGTFLGTGTTASKDQSKQILTYKQAKKLVHDWGITSFNEYREFVEDHFSDQRLPKRPDDYYANRGWTSWAEFLKPRFVDYKTAKKLMKPLGLRTESDFRKLGKEGRPVGVPSAPATYYKEFESWADFLGDTSKRHYPKRRSS